MSELGMWPTWFEEISAPRRSARPARPRLRRSTPARSDLHHPAAVGGRLLRLADSSGWWGDPACASSRDFLAAPSGGRRVFTDDFIDYRLAFLTKCECPPSGLSPHTETPSPSSRTWAAPPVTSAPSGPHVGHQGAQEVNVRPWMGVGKRLLEVLLGDEQNAFGVFGCEGNASVLVHQSTHGTNQFG